MKLKTSLEMLKNYYFKAKYLSCISTYSQRPQMGTCDDFGLAVVL